LMRNLYNIAYNSFAVLYKFLTFNLYFVMKKLALEQSSQIENLSLATSSKFIFTPGKSSYILL
jgi:hypothetical protein